MNNEEKIKEEIGKTLCEEYPNGCESCGNNPCKWEDGCCSTDCDIDKLYNADYRKAKEILQKSIIYHIMQDQPLLKLQKNMV